MTLKSMCVAKPCQKMNHDWSLVLKVVQAWKVMFSEDEGNLRTHGNRGSPNIEMLHRPELRIKFGTLTM